MEEDMIGKNSILPEYKNNLNRLEHIFPSAYRFLNEIPGGDIWISTSTNAHLYVRKDFLAYIKLPKDRDRYSLIFSPHPNANICKGTENQSLKLFSSRLPKIIEHYTSSKHWATRQADDSIEIGDQAPDIFFYELYKELQEIANYIPIAEEAEIEDASYPEGATKQIIVNIYERSTDGRAKCIEHFGLNCLVCNFNFERAYGTIGQNFIHVHHHKPLSEIGKEYKLNPIKDLCPVCPNCHAMLHSRKPAYTIEELREIISSGSIG
jgi:hypothetical protein